ncbi:hypothetical protein DRO03_11575 [Methanosarcinales archaeon]|nr:MAG: hypothetical protein DRO03_11575 [Methanosarcinales archaeon]
MKRTISLVCIAVLMMVAPALAAPDLSVTDIHVNFGDERSGDIVRVYVNCENIISAVVQNAGPDEVTDGFEVCFAADGAVIGCADVTGGLVADANTTVSIDWTPTCADYPVTPGFPPQSLPLTITVTADCNCSSCPNCMDDGSSGTIDEINETDNTRSLVIPAIQEFSGYEVIGGVVNNGYMSKNFDCDTTEEPLYLAGYFDTVGGGMTANVSGTKISTFATQATDTRVHHIDLPDGAAVLGARLYVHWYDKWDNYKTYPTGCLANLSVNFNGTDLMPEVVYHDSKGFGKYQSPKGCSVFNITSLVSGSGDYTAIVKNIEPIGGNNTTLLGEVLGVFYTGAHDYRVQLWVLEGTDYLMAADETRGDNNYSISPEMATSTVALPGEIDLTDIVDTRLSTFVIQGMANGSDLLFNGEVIKTDAWNTSTEVYPESKINIEKTSVLSELLSSNNNMGFRDNGSDGMQAACAALMVVHGSEPMPGDVNGDRFLTTADSVLALQMAVSGEYTGVADVNDDDAVTSIDALMILQAIVKNIEL